jgi:hypothetical protein
LNRKYNLYSLKITGSLEPGKSLLEKHKLDGQGVFIIFVIFVSRMIKKLHYDFATAANT